MSAVAVFLLFGLAFVAAVWTLVASILPQLHRFAALGELMRPVQPAPALPPRLSRMTVRAAPARMPLRATPRRAAA